MYNLTLRGSKGWGRTPLKTNVPIDSTISGQIFMSFGKKFYTYGRVYWTMFYLIWEGTYGHKNCWTSRCQDWCNLKKGDNSPPKRVYTYRHKNYGKDLYDIYNLDSK